MKSSIIKKFNFRPLMISIMSIMIIVTLATLSSFQFPVTEAQDETVLHDKGLELFNSGDYTGAIEYFDRCLEINPDKLGCLINKGSSLYFLHDEERAIEYYDKALEINSYNEAALKFKAIACKGDTILPGDENGDGSVKTVPSSSCFDLQ